MVVFKHGCVGLWVSGLSLSVVDFTSRLSRVDKISMSNNIEYNAVSYIIPLQNSSFVSKLVNIINWIVT